MRKLVAALLLSLASVSAALAQNVSLPFNAPTTRTAIVIVTGNTFQTILAVVANPANNPASRHSLTIQNNNASDSCWIDYGVGVTAANATEAAGILLTAGQAYTRYYPYIPSDEIEATCATTSDTMRVEIQ